MVISARRVVVVALCLLAACASPGDPSTSASQLASSPTPTSVATPEVLRTDAPTPIPTADQPRLEVDDFAEVVTTDLVVRSAPGTGPDSEIYGTVANDQVTVLDGPVQADGYEWWLIEPVHSDGFEPPPSGWVAAGGQGEVWLAPTSLSCVEAAPSSGLFWQLPSALWVNCLGGVELTLRGTLWGCASAAGAGWEHGCSLRNCVPDVCQGMVDDRAVIVHFDALPAQFEGRIRVTGHFDDPVAEGCGDDADPLSRLYVFWCRKHFVATSYRFAD